jgi:hypothetical protein
VAEDVRRLSPEAAAVVVAILAIVVSIVLFILGRILSRRQERRWRQEAEARRPRPVVNFREVQFHHRPENPGSKLVQVAVIFDVANTGGSAAHNVECHVSLDEEALELDDMHGPNRGFTAALLRPSVPQPYSLNAGIRAYGPTKARYKCVYNEGVAEGELIVVVPHPPAHQA